MIIVLLYRPRKVPSDPLMKQSGGDIRLKMSNVASNVTINPLLTLWRRIVLKEYSTSAGILLSLTKPRNKFNKKGRAKNYRGFETKILE
jgi:hypothetical protein